MKAVNRIVCFLKMKNVSDPFMNLSQGYSASPVTPSKYLIVTGLLLVLAGCATNSRITNAPATTGDIEPFTIILKIALLFISERGEVLTFKF